MKLVNILNRNLILPLGICLISTSVIVTIINLIFCPNLYTEDEFKNKIKSGKNKSVSLVLTLIQEFLYERIQLVFDYLITTREVLDKYHSNWKNEDFPDIKYYQKYLISILSFYRDTKIDDLLENKMVWFINDNIDDSNFYNDLPSDKPSSKKYVQLKYLFLFSKIIPVFKAFFNNFKGKDSFSIETFYIMNRKTELLAIYPIRGRANFKQMYEFKEISQNSKNCKNKERKVPDYFYIFCREAFLNIEDIYSKNRNRRMFITYPFETVDKNREENPLCLAICYIFNFTNNNDIIENDIFKKTLNDEIVVCADVVINSYIELLDTYQNQLHGYFYILLTQKKYPMYYPGMLEDQYLNDITRYEFNFSYYNFSISNVTNFNTITLPKLIKEYNPEEDILLPNSQNEKDNKENKYYYTVKMKENKNLFQKGNETFEFYIYPLFYDNYHFYSDNPNEKVNGSKEHVLSIIYILNQNNFNQQFNSLFPYIIFLSTIFCITFLLIGLIILICASYGAFIISNNITKPIKDIKFRLKAGISKKNNIIKGLKDKNEFYYQGIHINKLISLGIIDKRMINLNKKQKQDINDQLNIEFDRNSNDLFGRHILGNEIILRGNAKTEEEEDDNEEEKFLNNDNNNNLKNEEEEDEDDEEDDNDDIPLVKNSEINNQFNLLLDLKKIILFMRGPQVNFKGSNIIKFISCDKVFREIKNKLGENVCLSNIGNLENLKKRFDKSIIFLSKSLELDNDNSYLLNKDILAIVDSIFEKDEKGKIKGIEEFNNKLKESYSNASTFNLKSTLKKEGSYKEKNKNQINSNINNIEFIRFIKLFYAYKMYFSNVKKIEKILNKTLHMTKTKNNNGKENLEKSQIYIYVKSILVYFNDYYISNSIHIHKKYKAAIYTCLRRLIESKDITKKKEKIIYCYIELFTYYISYLKIKIKREINEINDNNNENDFSISKEYDKLNQLKSNNKKKNEKCFNKMVNITKKLKEYIKKLNLKIEGKESNYISDGEKNKYKDFLSELKTVDQKNSNIQFNIFLIEQKYKYLFAKFSKLCGDYAMAITYYLKVVDEQKLISNGLLYMKANKKIVNIISFAINNPQFLSIQEKDEKIMKEILEKCNRNLENTKKIIHKDLIIILDRNYYNTDIEKIYRLQMKQYKAIITIFENYMSLNDRFAFYTFGNEIINYEDKEKENEDIYIEYIKNNSIKKLISLRYKNNKNYSFIKGIIDKFHDDIINNYENQTKIKQMYLNMNRDDLNKSSFILENSMLKGKPKSKYNTSDIYKMKIKFAINSIFKVIGDFNIHDEERKKFIILMSESFKNEQNNEIDYKVKDLFKDINDNYKIKIERLFIIGTLLEEQNKFNSICGELMNYGIKNEYLEFENIQEMNKKFLTLGKLPREYEYQNEKLNK